jgi:hypothetical protein
LCIISSTDTSAVAGPRVGWRRTEALPTGGRPRGVKRLGVMVSHTFNVRDGDTAVLAVIFEPRARRVK